ncbi:MAG: sulfotransferase [Candidatus Limnocylindrales bacterium]
MPQGWMTGPPDYIGIGVQKAGTTRWWKLIAKHPDVVGELKETHQLSRFGWRPMFEADREAYYRYFPRPQGKLAGEWTPRYMNVPGVVDTMKALAPDAKLLVLLRDPVERYRSGVGQWQKHKERRGKRPNLWAGRKDAYARSFYAYALRPYVEAFGRERLLVLQFEKCLQDPAAEYQRTLAFLGLPAWTPPPEILGRRVNVAKRRPTPAELGEPADLVVSLEEDVRELLELVPEIDLSLWPNFRQLAPGGASDPDA